MRNGRYLVIGVALVLGAVACSGSVISGSDESSSAGANNGVIAGAASIPSGGSSHVSPPSSSGGAPTTPPRATAGFGGARTDAEAGAAGSGECTTMDGVTHRVGVSFPCDCNTCWYESDCLVYGTLIGCPDDFGQGGEGGEGGASGQGGASAAGSAD